MQQLAVRTFRPSAIEWATPHTADAAPRHAPSIFQETVTSEVHALAVAIAVVTSAANSLADWRTTISPADVARFAPHWRPLSAMMTFSRDTDSLGAALTTALDDFIGQIDEANDALTRYLDDAEVLGEPRAGALHALQMQSGWRRLCGETRNMLIEFDDDLTRGLPELYLQNSRVVCALLTGAASGMRPCLDAEGRLYVPELPQKRRWPRRAVLEPCLVRAGSTCQMSFVRDASCGGLGLDRISGLRRGDVVEVEMGSGRRFQGTIAWAADTTAGVHFDAVLPADDPLIAI